MLGQIKIYISCQFLYKQARDTAQVSYLCHLILFCWFWQSYKLVSMTEQEKF